VSSSAASVAAKNGELITPLVMLYS